MTTDELLPVQLRMARALLGVDQSDIARWTELHPRTVGQFESGAGRPNRTTIRLIKEALASRGVLFGVDGDRVWVGGTPGAVKEVDGKPG